jgi:predicted nucleic acid-binding protein
MKYLLDTSVYCQPLKKKPLETVVRRWKDAGDIACCVSVFCEMEVLQGLRMSGSKKLNNLYQAILQDKLPILPFTLEEAKTYAGLQAEAVSRGKVRPVIDLGIAATAITHGLILATLNEKDFAGIPRLQVESWTT